MIDTHCHLNFPDAFCAPEETIAKAIDAGVEAMVVVGLDRESNDRAITLAENHPAVWAAVGWHPNYSATYTSQELGPIRELLDHPRVVALGEIGLDSHWDYATPEQQDRCLRDQLELAFETQKPVVFHCRKAYTELLAILEVKNPQKCVFHCFSGDASDLERAKKLDAYFGFDGPVTYKNNHDLRDIVRSVPRDRLVIETDSPFLTPEPFRGKPNEPANLIWVNRGIAGTLAISEVESALLTSENSRRLFNI